MDNKSRERKKQTVYNKTEVQRTARTERKRPHVGAGFSNTPKPNRFQNTTARKLALNALCDVTIGDAYSNIALDRRLRSAEISDADRRLATGIFYTALDNRNYIDYVLNHFIDHMPEEKVVRELLHVACAQILYMDRVPDYAAVDEAVEQIRAFNRAQYAPLINGVLRSVIRSRDNKELPVPDRRLNVARYFSIMYSLPETIAQRLIQAYGEETAQAIASYRPVDRWETIRPNLSIIDDLTLEQMLNKNGWSYEKGVVPHCYRISGVGNLALTNEYRRGLFSVQSESSVLAALAMEAKPGMIIIDACAAPGGKTAMMAETMSDSGRVYAYDLHEHRVDLIRRNVARLHLFNVRPVQADATVFRSEHDAAVDAVLIDAPCSGLGVMLSKPDLRFRISDTNVTTIVKTQRDLLNTCSRYVKPGGLLVYSTCTLLPEENCDQLTAFLSDNPDFVMDNSDKWLPDPLKAHFKDGMIQLLAHRDLGLDGFFIARIRRKKR